MITATVLDWAESYGPVFVFAATLISCLGAPIPALVVMLAAGAAAAAGDDPLVPYFVAALGGSLISGIAVFALGRRFGTAVLERLEARPRWGPILARAHATHDRWGGAAVFVGSSFVAQLGPVVNLLAGASELAWWRFHLGHTAGRTIWVTTYLTLGFLFADRIDEVAQTVAGVTWLFVGIIVALLALWALRRTRR